MKKLKLKKWVKVVISLIIIEIGILIYSQTGKLGELAQNNAFYLLLCIMSWIWLIFGSAGSMYCIWEK